MGSMKKLSLGYFTCDRGINSECHMYVKIIENKSINNMKLNIYFFIQVISHRVRERNMYVKLSVD